MNLLLSLLLLFSSTGFAQTAPTAESNAEVAVTENAIEQTQSAAGPQWVFNYSYYKYSMEGDKTANTGIYKFGKGTTELHLVSATWLYSQQWTFVALLPWIRNEVETIYVPSTPGSVMTNDVTQGVGDLRLMAISPWKAQEQHLLMYDISVTVPTGSTTEDFSSDLAKSLNQRASYNMQPGSGTPDLILGTSYTYSATPSWVQTARAQVTVRGGRNAQGWNLGTEYQASLASRYQATSFLNVGVAGNFKSREPIQGRDGKYELFNQYNAGGISGDGHQYYHAYQTSWDTSLVAKFHTPVGSQYSASFEAGVPFWQGFINKDNIDFNIQNWFAASLTAVF